MAKICVLTAIKPNMSNEGGGPSGLIWEVIEFLKKRYSKVDVQVVPQAMRGLKSLAQRYGYLRPPLQVDLSSYDYLLVYPDSLFVVLPKAVRSRAVVLGPDSPSWRDIRPYAKSKGLRKVFKRFEVCLARRVEVCILREARALLVVGRTDQLYTRRNPLLRQHRELQKKCIFLRHPVLSKVVQDLDIKNWKSGGRKRFVFSGNMVNAYSEPFFAQLFQALSQRQCASDERLQILVTGHDNEPVARRFQEISCCQTEYLPWVEKYSDICLLGQDVHCLPLVIGSGTKNRILTALAMGLEVITTPIGSENVRFRNLSGICITPRPERFADYMWENNKPFQQDEMEKLLVERKHFLEETLLDYTETLAACFADDEQHIGETK